MNAAAFVNAPKLRWRRALREEARQGGSAVREERNARGGEAQEVVRDGGDGARRR